MTYSEFSKARRKARNAWHNDEQIVRAIFSVAVLAMVAVAVYVDTVAAAL